MLSSDPQAVLYSGWLTATLPASAAIFNGGRKVMTEVSDFSQKMAGKGPVSTTDMMATAAWQAALGVTEFTLYYGYRQREKEAYKQYCDCVGRLNAILREARLVPDVLLYYPIHDLWAEYLPVAQKLTLDTQSERMQRIVGSFLKLGQRMVRKQISFAVADYELLAKAEVRDKAMWIAGRRFEALVLPALVELPAPAAEVVERFKASGGRVLLDQEPGRDIDYDLLSALYANGRLASPNERIVVGRFSRQGRPILVVVNVGAEPYNGKISAKAGAQWLIAHPESGNVERVATESSGWLPVSLPSHGAMLLIREN
jgi:hypothetical protein